MNFLKNIFNKKDDAIKSYSDFWEWFEKNNKEFFSVVKKGKNIERGFFDRISPKLAELKEGYFYLTGMKDENTVELVLTADGNTNNIVFVEELINAAPEIDGWKFIAHKPAMDIEGLGINMYGYKFEKENMNFYSNEDSNYPDEIDITIVHNDLSEDNKEEIRVGTSIFLDNYLGELDFVNNIDNIKTIGRQEAKKVLIPIFKLKDFLTWRQKEFIEKYDGFRYDTENDTYTLFEAELESGNMLLAVMNAELLNWDSKASHPWIATLVIKYDGSKDNGMPNETDYKLLDKIEEEIMLELKDIDGYLNIGRQTSNGEREIYFACKDFRKPSKVFYTTKQNYSKNFDIEYEIYKDKYWQSFERFNNSIVEEL
jgi:Family of unknown function (DUF695)